MEKGIQYISSQRGYDKNIKVNVKHITNDKIAVEFLSVTSFCWIGWYKWYFRNEFDNVFETTIGTIPDK